MFAIFASSAFGRLSLFPAIFACLRYFAVFLLVFANVSLFLLVCVQYREVFNLIELSYFPPSRKKAKRRGYAPPGNAAAKQLFAGPTERAFLLHLAEKLQCFAF